MHTIHIHYCTLLYIKPTFKLKRPIVIKFTNVRNEYLYYKLNKPVLLFMSQTSPKKCLNNRLAYIQFVSNRFDDIIKVI